MRLPSESLWQFAHGNVEITDDQPNIITSIPIDPPPRDCYREVRARVMKALETGLAVDRVEAQSAMDIALRCSHISKIQFQNLSQLLNGA